MSKNEEHVLLIAGGLFVLWLVMQSSRLPTTGYVPGAVVGTGGGLIGSLTNLFNATGNLFRGIGGTPPAATTTQSIVAGDHTGIAGPDDLAPVDF